MALSYYDRQSAWRIWDGGKGRRALQVDQLPEQVPDWAPEGADLTRPSAARMYDYYLGGAHNFAVDRELAGQVLALFPDGQLIAQANRAFLHRVVRYLL